ISWKEPEKNKLSYLEKKEYKTLEKEIKQLEDKKLEIQDKFTDTSLSREEIEALCIELGELSDTIDQKTERRFELADQLG
ncbi:ABC transporter C-terminal domain-containing protein, partial [Maribacter flavus]|uniref:ABC transporter C-terminal domain-containing protein n=1 Tax=Maribacter flavus TaxID=1658664 RepID=UPI003D32DCD2